MSHPLAELAVLFLRLGVSAFGGPAAHIALMRELVVRRRGWLSDEEFVDMLGATNLIPGPNSTEMAIHIGHRRAGFAGLVVAGLAFIVPASLITLAIAWAYVRWGARPEGRWLMYGVKPVVIAIVLQAIAGLAPVAARTRALVVLGVATGIAAAVGVNEFVLLFAAGVVAIAMAAAERRRRAHAGGGGKASVGCALLPLGSVALAGPASAGAATAAAPIASAAGVATGTAGASALFWVFAKIGAVLFGSGYVLLAFLRSELVERYGWLDPAQLIDAVAIGQVTPGPVFTTATFIGYLLGGGAGAFAATAGIFLPAFVFVAASAPLVPRLRRSWIAGGFLDGVNVASLALMAVVTLQLTRAAIVDVPTGVLAIASGVLLLRYRVDPTLLIAGAAVAGLLLEGRG
jgi:chromate transporter